MANAYSFSQLRRFPLAALSALAEQPPGIIHLSGVTPPTVILSDPDLVREVVSGEKECYAKSPLPSSLRPLLGDGTAASWFPPEMTTLDTLSANLDDLREQRGGALSKFLHAATTVSNGVIESLVSEFARSQSNSEPTDIHALMHEQMFRVAMECLFKVTTTAELLGANRAIHKSASSLHQHLRSATGYYAPYFDRVYAPRFELWRWLPGSRFNTLRARRRAINAVTNLLINNAASSDHQRRFSMIGLLLASYENSAAVCAWAIWCLSTHPEWQDQVREEVNAKPLTFDTASDLFLDWPFLRATLNETLRLYPPIWSMGRMVQKAVRLDNHELLPKSAVIISPWLQHRHTAFWENNESFHPERFLSGPIINGTFLPFGVEPHTCPGERFSWLTIAAVLAEMLKVWRFLPVENTTPQPMLGLTQRPEKGIMIRLTPRK